jgi:hypothetical protein
MNTHEKNAKERRFVSHVLLAIAAIAATVAVTQCMRDFVAENQAARAVEDKACTDAGGEWLNLRKGRRQCVKVGTIIEVTE